MSKEEMKSLINQGQGFDYTVSYGAPDHYFVKSLGYDVKMGSDCSFYAPGLHDISLSSYGNWGTFYGNMDAESKDVAIKMIDEGIVEFWRY